MTGSWRSSRFLRRRVAVAPAPSGSPSEAACVCVFVYMSVRRIKATRRPPGEIAGACANAQRTISQSLASVVSASARFVDVGFHERVQDDNLVRCPALRCRAATCDWPHLSPQPRRESFASRDAARSWRPLAGELGRPGREVYHSLTPVSRQRDSHREAGALRRLEDRGKTVFVNPPPSHVGPKGLCARSAHVCVYVWSAQWTIGRPLWGSGGGAARSLDGQEGGHLDSLSRPCTRALLGALGPKLSSPGRLSVEPAAKAAQASQWRRGAPQSADSRGS